MDTLSKLAVGAALVYGLQQIFFKEAPKQAPKVQEATKEVGQRVVRPSLSEKTPPIAE